MRRGLGLGFSRRSKTGLAVAPPIRQAIGLVGHSLVNHTVPQILRNYPRHPEDVVFEQVINGSTLINNWNNADVAEGANLRIMTLDGEIDTLVLTEAGPVGTSWPVTEEAAVLFVDNLRGQKPAGKPFFFETWPDLLDFATTPEWQAQLAADMEAFYEPLVAAFNRFHTGASLMKIVPVGQGFSAVSDYITAGPGIPGVTGIGDFIGNGVDDGIHNTGLGLYFVAMMMYAAIYNRSPVGLSHAPVDAVDAPIADMPTATQAAVLQQIAWSTWQGYAQPPFVPYAPVEGNITVVSSDAFEHYGSGASPTTAASINVGPAAPDRRIYVALRQEAHNSGDFVAATVNGHALTQVGTVPADLASRATDYRWGLILLEGAIPTGDGAVTLSLTMDVNSDYPQVINYLVLTGAAAGAAIVGTNTSDGNGTVQGEGTPGGLLWLLNARLASSALSEGVGLDPASWQTATTWSTQAAAGYAIDTSAGLYRFVRTETGGNDYGNQAVLRIPST